MDHISRRRKNEHLLESVFRVEDIEQHLRSRSIGDETRDETGGYIRDCRSNDGYLRSCLSHRSQDCDRDGNESADTDIPVIQKLSISLSSSSNMWYNEGCIAEDSRDQAEEMNIRDGERTEAIPQETTEHFNGVNPHAEAEGNDFSLRNTLKRANPIYESDNEAECHVDVDNRHHQFIKRRRSSIGFASATPLYWSEQLPIE